MPNRRRGSSMDIRANDVAALLGRAGWTMRSGGNHFVLTKEGHPNITLSERVSSMTQFKNIERVLGVQLETLVNKRRGKFTANEAELRHRLDLARDMQRIGFPVDYTSKTAGLSVLTANKFTPLMLAALSNDEVLERFWRRTPVPVPTVLPEFVPAETHAPSNAEIQHDLMESATPVAVTERPDDISGMLELLGELQADVRGISSARNDRSVAYAERLRIARGQSTKLRAILVETLSTVDELLDTLGGYS